MKRMKKKVVAMVTLAMFVMSMLPMAAFAAAADPQTSVFKTVEVNPTVAVKDEVEAEFEVNTADYQDVVEAFPEVLVWATDDQGRVSSAMTVKDQSNKAGYATKLTNVDNDTKVNLIFSREGEYTLHAGIGSDVDAAEKNELSCDSVVTVEAQEVTIDKIKVAGAANQEGEKGGSLEFKDSNDNWLVPNGINKLPVTVQITAKANADQQVPPVKGQVVTIENTNDNIAVVDDNDKAITEVKVDSQGKASFNIVPNATVGNGYYHFILKAGSESYDLTVKIGQDKNEVKTIEVVDADATVIGSAAKDATLEKVAKFVAKDEQGNVVAPDSLATTEKVISQSNGAKADFNVVKVADEDAYTLQVVAPSNGLKAGDYVVRVALNNERSSVDLKFTVKAFDEAVDIQFGKVTQLNYGEVTDTIVWAGGRVSGVVEYVDENGVTADATTAVIGIEGPAVVKPEVSGNEFSFGTGKVDGEKEPAIGSKVVVTVYDKTTKKTISKEFTVVDKNDVNAKTLEFDAEAGKVQVQNPVNVTLVDKDGKLVKKTTDNNFGYYVASQSNKDANINVTSVADLKDGKGKIKVYSDKATTAEIVVYVKVGEQVYGNTLKYTFGEEDVLADTSVVMTLGSTEMLVNNNIVDMKDAAPFAQNNRTYVPFRALGEALGAQVDYDKDAKTVTYTLGGTKIVMTLDSKTYTVNGVEKTMDVAPFAKDNRTYVPVRFVGEGLGFKVTGLQDGNGKYVAVAFTK